MTGSDCATCGAAIRWVVTEHGKRMPIDVSPVNDGNIVLRERLGQTPIAVVLTGGMFGAIEQPKGARYKSHFATCPQAAQHRRGR